MFGEGVTLAMLGDGIAVITLTGDGVDAVTIAGEIVSIGVGEATGSDGEGFVRVTVVVLRLLDTLVSRATSVATATTITRKTSANRVRGCLAHFIPRASPVNG